MSWDTTLPAALRRLQDVEAAFVDGIDFELHRTLMAAAETKAWIQAWTGNKTLDGSVFRVFGQDGSGGYAAFWLLAPARDLLQQPIVFFGSEGALGPVAADYVDFVWLLAAGIGPLEAVDFGATTGTPRPEITRLAQDLGAARTPLEIRARAHVAAGTFEPTIRSLVTY
jgi:hypothetical protein